MEAGPIVGIGQATAIALANAGYRVVLVARSEANLAQTAKQCEAFESGHLVIAGDVGDEGFAIRAFAQTFDECGKCSAAHQALNDSPTELWWV